MMTLPIILHPDDLIQFKKKIKLTDPIL